MRVHALDVWPVGKVVPLARDKVRAVQVGQGSVKQVTGTVEAGVQHALLLVDTHRDLRPGGCCGCIACEFAVVLNRAVFLAACHVVDGKRPTFATQHARVGRLSAALWVEDLRAGSERDVCGWI